MPNYNSIEYKSMIKDIEDLKEQNILDFQDNKNLRKEIEKLEEQLRDKTKLNDLKMRKIERDYAKLKRVIIDENVSITLNNKIDTSKKELNNKIETNRAEVNSELSKINEQLNNKANKDDITRLSSGTPLFASSISGMIDTTKNYVNTTDGYLYRYNGSAFEKTTVLYQATGIDDVNQKKIDRSIQGRMSVNIFNKATQVDGFLSSIGTILVNADYFTSDFIEVEEGNYSGIYHKGQWFICKYDSSKTIVGSRVLNSNSNISFTVESDVKYVRISFKKSTENLQIQRGSKLTAYEEYGKSFIVEDSISQDLKNAISQKSSNVIKVSKENGDYDSLTLAIANSNNGDVIIIYPGVYDNEKIVNRDKDISIIGLDKTKCIIQNSFDVYGQDPITMTQGYIANLTIKALASDDYIYQDGVSECYCLHVDTAGDNSNLLVENCDFYSWHWACVGIGLHQNQKIKFKGCEMYNMQDDVLKRRYAALFHQRNADNVDEQELIFENCLMKSKAGKTFSYQKVGNNSNMILTMYRNILFDEVNGTNCLNGFIRSGENLDVSGSLKLSNDSFGNNVATLNA